MALRLRWLLLSAIHLAVFLPLSLVVWAPSIVCAVLRAVLAKLGCLPTTVATTSTSAAERRTAQSSRATSHLLFAQPTLPAESLTRPRLFFDGTGHMFPFCLGVTSHIIQRFRIDRNACLFAISGGNFGALCLLLQKDPREVLPRLFPRVSRAHAQEPLFGFLGSHDALRRSLDEWLPNNIHKIATDRLYIVISPYPHLGFTFVSQFQTRRSLIDAVVASCRFPFLVWRPQFACFRNSASDAVMPGFFFDAGFQNGLTPLDPTMHLSIRTFAVGVPECAGSLVPKRAQARLLRAASPLGLDEAMRMMDLARADAKHYFDARYLERTCTFSETKEAAIVQACEGLVAKRKAKTIRTQSTSCASNEC